MYWIIFHSHFRLAGINHLRPKLSTIFEMKLKQRDLAELPETSTFRISDYFSNSLFIS